MAKISIPSYPALMNPQYVDKIGIIKDCQLENESSLTFATLIEVFLTKVYQREFCWQFSSEDNISKMKFKLEESTDKLFRLFFPEYEPQYKIEVGLNETYNSLEMDIKGDELYKKIMRERVDVKTLVRRDRKVKLDRIKNGNNN